MTKERDKWGFKYTKQIFEYLKLISDSGDIVFYSTIADEFHTSARSLGGRELKAIWDECDANDWPHLNALVVRKKDSIPGDGYKPGGSCVSRNQFENIKRCVYKTDWSNKHL